MAETSISTGLGLPGSVIIDRPANKHWRVFDIARGQVIITAAGQEYIHDDPSILFAFKSYRNDIGAHTADTRQWLKSGGNSDVYSLIHPSNVVVKEQSTAQSVWSALNRMDHLYHLATDYIDPNVIRVVKGLGAVFSGQLRRQYLIMERINSGLTVEDIRERRSQEEYGYTDEERELILVQFEDAKRQLDKVIAEHAEGDAAQMNLLPDWHEGNVLIDFTTPTELRRYSMVLVDQ